MRLKVFPRKDFLGFFKNLPQSLVSQGSPDLLKVTTVLHSPLPPAGVTCGLHYIVLPATRKVLVDKGTLSTLHVGYIT